MKAIIAIIAVSFSIAALTPLYYETHTNYLTVDNNIRPSYLVDGVLFANELSKYNARSKTIHCLATMIYGEARSESTRGQIGVAYTAKNRTKNKDTICNEVVKPYQYSVFNGNPILIKVALNPDMMPRLTNATDSDSWEDAKLVAEAVYNGTVTDPTHGATHYLSPKLMKKQRLKMPKWAKRSRVIAIIENHKFFKV